MALFTYMHVPHKENICPNNVSYPNRSPHICPFLKIKPFGENESVVFVWIVKLESLKIIMTSNVSLQDFKLKFLLNYTGGNISQYKSYPIFQKKKPLKRPMSEQSEFVGKNK